MEPIVATNEESQTSGGALYKRSWWEQMVTNEMVQQSSADPSGLVA